MSHVSLKDVATRTGVTFPTVSKVLKGKGIVSPKMRVAIFQVARSFVCFPALTTVHIPFHEIGETALRLLLELIEQRITAPQTVLLPVHLVSRSSSIPGSI